MILPPKALVWNLTFVLGVRFSPFCLLFSFCCLGDVLICENIEIMCSELLTYLDAKLLLLLDISRKTCIMVDSLMAKPSCEFLYYNKGRLLFL